MSLSKIPSYTSLQDGQFISISGPDGVTTSYLYDEQQRALYFKESQTLFPAFHGASHIAEDPIPGATCDTPGLMSSDDKCKLDALLQTRLGVLGFQGAGFPDDGGWMNGDIILAAGTEFISIERIGNVVRFTVDSPVPLNCACEGCTDLYWVQDETDVNSIRPPVCSGKLPSVNSYGELKVYSFPSTLLVDSANAKATLNNKGNYPSLIFKRYDDSLAPGSNEFELTLKRNSVNKTTTEIGWVFTPGATAKPQCVWFMGLDAAGNQRRFEFDVSADPAVLGSMLYRGNLITRQKAVVTSYTSNILSTNVYNCRMWDVDGQRPAGDTFTAKNAWQYANPESSTTGNNPRTLLLDATIDLLPIGTLVDIWFFKVGEVAGEPIRRYYFCHRPSVNPRNLWADHGEISFGDVLVARKDGTDVTAGTIPYELVSGLRDLERDEWGITGLSDTLYYFNVVEEAGTGQGVINEQSRAIVDTSIPALKVLQTVTTDGAKERPITVWSRRSAGNAYVKALIGRPELDTFSPYDIILRGPVDAFKEQYVYMMGKGTVQDLDYISITGVPFDSVPQFGTLKCISPINNRAFFFRYSKKMMGAGASGFDRIVLVSTEGAYQGSEGDVLELMPQDYTSLACRLEFGYDALTGLLTLQVKIGTLDMTKQYEQNATGSSDDYVRGLADGHTVSAIYTQAGTYSGVGTKPDTSPDSFVIYDGGLQTGGEFWNKLEIICREDQVWVWWNELLLPPSGTLSAQLAQPVSVSSPFFPIPTQTNQGKYGVRMWPGSYLRRLTVKSQLTSFSELRYGQLEIN
jgi:hypothetical protein